MAGNVSKTRRKRDGGRHRVRALLGAWCGLLSPLGPLALVGVCFAASAAQPSSRISFHLPADEFPRALLEFSRPAPLPVVFSRLPALRRLDSLVLAGPVWVVIVLVASHV